MLVVRALSSLGEGSILLVMIVFFIPKPLLPIREFALKPLKGQNDEGSLKDLAVSHFKSVFGHSNTV